MCVKLTDMKLFRAGFWTALIILVIFFLTPQKATAATLTTARDTITTSRPSPSSPLNAALGSTDSQATIFSNSSRYLASDSAKLIRTSTGILIDTGTIVASQSAALTTVFFAEQAGSAGDVGTDVLFVPITAMHTIQFTVVNAVPTNGDIVLTFPTLTSGDADNDASPSATTFQFNNLVTGTGGRDNIDFFDDSSDISANVTITETEPSAGSPGTLSLNLDSGTIGAGSVVKIYLGCTTSTSSSCSTQTPRIINPTKTAAAGTRDRWKIKIDTENATDVLLDTATVAIATIESVQVLATVDPTLTFTIAGVDDADHILPINTGNTTGCTNTETTNAGLASTETVVNLGILSSTPAVDTKIANIAAQLITVATNGVGGYSLTATSSGSLQDPATGYAIASNTTPAAFPASNEWFGIHACGLDVAAATWVEGGASQSCVTQPSGSSSTECFYGWPTKTTSVTLASDTSGPVDNTIAAGNGLISVEYAAGVDASVPAGIYQSYVTYVATPTF